jgi:hypothetical protein
VSLVSLNIGGVSVIYPKSYYWVLCYGIGIDFPWKSIWRAKVPLKFAFFTWIAVLGKILTIYLFFDK